MPVSILPMRPVSRVVGSDVEGTDGKQLGSIETIIVDEEAGKIIYAIVAVRRLLGIQRDFVIIPWQLLRSSTRRGAYALSLSADKLRNAPVIDPDKLPDLTSKEWNSQVMHYYGLDPYWNNAGRTGEIDAAKQATTASGPETATDAKASDNDKLLRDNEESQALGADNRNPVQDEPPNGNGHGVVSLHDRGWGRQAVLNEHRDFSADRGGKGREEESASKALAMVRSLDLVHFKPWATDGEIGHVSDLYFDSKAWQLRYLVVDTGTWLTVQQVLVSPHAIERVSTEDKLLRLNLSREQLEKCPPVDLTRPISRQYEERYHQHYGWQGYWANGGSWGFMPGPGAVGLGTALPSDMVVPESSNIHVESKTVANDSGESYLHSLRDLEHYAVHGQGVEFGKVAGLLIDANDWKIRYLEIDTGKILTRKRVLVSLEWLEGIDWVGRVVHVSMGRELVESAPEYLPERRLTDGYLAELDEHYRTGSQKVKEHRSQNEILLSDKRTDRGGLPG